MENQLISCTGLGGSGGSATTTTSICTYTNSEKVQEHYDVILKCGGVNCPTLKEMVSKTLTVGMFCNLLSESILSCRGSAAAMFHPNSLGN